MTTRHPFWQYITTVPNFPKEGVDFYDISPLLDGHLGELTQSLLSAIDQDTLAKTQGFCAIESRGFILASLLAQHCQKPLILIRKQGKLPPPVHRQHYALEYGMDALEIAPCKQKRSVLLVDDVLATGGTLNAATLLCQQAGYEVLGAVVLLDLTTLHPALKTPLFRVLTH